MNRIVCLLLIMLCIFSFTACNTKEPTTTSSNITTAPTATEVDTEPVLNADTEYIIAETDEVEFIIKGTPKHDDMGNIVFNIYAQNKTDNNLQYKIDNILINGQLFVSSFNITVSAHTETESVISLMLAEEVVTTDTIAFTLIIFNENDNSDSAPLSFPFYIDYNAVG